jgi:hypothetical protein
VDGKPVWLVSGTIHYFRTPSQLWADRLLKAKRAGLNCIETPVAWNFHEPVEGQWQLGGDHDVAGFVRLAGQMGLYVILRPGPYIGSAWDFGGLPGWLTTKPGMAYRTVNAAYTHYYDKYFRQVLPRLAELQVTRGGNVILIQNEHQYVSATMPDRLNYLQFISQLFRRYGFDIPIINCNLFSDPPLPDSIEGVCTSHHAVQQLKRMRLRQPDRPLLVTAMEMGGFDRWGGTHARRDARQSARRVMEILGCGGQYNYASFHGGTNFGFWGGRLESGQATYQTTSFDGDALLAEGGGLTEKYYATRLVNMLANHLGPTFAQAIMADPPVSIHDASDALYISGPLGGWGIITNNGRADITQARVSLPLGKELDVSLEPFGAAAVPVQLKLNPATTLDYANLTPLGLFGQKFLLLHGPADWPTCLSVNGKELTLTVPRDEQPAIVEHQGLTVVVVTSGLAMRTWPVDETLVFGPQFVGKTLEEVTAKGDTEYCTLSLTDGKLTRHKAKASPRTPAAPRLGTWRRIAVCREPVAGNLAWQKIDRPRSTDALGQSYGYVWYRLEFHDVPPGRRHLFLPDCSDRATLYLNGKLLGIWGRGAEATRSPIPATFKSGKNVLTVLVDNLGRFQGGPMLGDSKGLWGHVYDAAAAPMKFKLQRAEGFPRRIVPRQHLHLLPSLEHATVWEAVTSISLPRVTPLHLSFADIPNAVAVICNERTAGFFPATDDNFGDVTLGAELKKGRNVIKLLIWGNVTEETLEHFLLHSLLETLSQQASWSFRPWMMPAPGGHIVGKDQPAWYVAKFTCDVQDVPLFLHLVGAKKGQIFLNGHNLGRFWAIGPQEYYYLPACWLQHENELMLFEEQGHIPRRSSLAFRPLGPYQE